MNVIVNNESIENVINTQVNESLNKEINNLMNKNKMDIDDKVFLYQDTKDGYLFDEIYKAYLPKLKYMAFKMKNEDIVQELSIVLLNAVQTFKEGTNAKFNTYFWTCAKNHLGVLNTHNWAQKRAHNNYLLSLHKTITGQDGSETEFGDLIEDPDAYMKFDNIDFIVFLENNIYPFLNKDDKFMIQKFVEGYTHEEISKMLDVTTQNIHSRFKKLKTQLKIKDALVAYYGCAATASQPRKKRQRRLTMEEVDSLIKSRVNYTPGDYLLTEAIINKRYEQGDNNEQTISKKS